MSGNIKSYRCIDTLGHRHQFALADPDIFFLDGRPTQAVGLDLIVAFIFQARVKEQVVGPKRSLHDADGIFRLPGKEHGNVLIATLSRIEP